MRRFKYRQAIREAEQDLLKHSREIRIAELLMSDLFDYTTTQLMLNANEVMSQDEKSIYDKAVQRVCAGEPYQYVVGFSWFYGEKFKVGPDVLIPRNETEELVMTVLENVSDDGRIVVDIGTGTGVIPITLKKDWHSNNVLATDISEAALKFARANNELHKTDIDLFHGDLYEPLIENGVKADVIISNPPYISREEVDLMTPSVIEHEPHLALFAEDEGLLIYKRLMDELSGVLKPGGRVYFEIAFNQKERLLKYLLKRWPETTHFGVLKDMNRHDRILYFQWEG